MSEDSTNFPLYDWQVEIGGTSPPLSDFLRDFNDLR